MIQREEIDFIFHFLKCIRKYSRFRIDNIIDAFRQDRASGESRPGVPLSGKSRRQQCQIASSTIVAIAEDTEWMIFFLNSFFNDLFLVNPFIIGLIYTFRANGGAIAGNEVGHPEDLERCSQRLELALSFTESDEKGEGDEDSRLPG